MDLEPRYEQEPSYDIRDTLRLVLLFHSGGIWGEPQATEWLRITGTREATTKVMCDHVRSALAVADSDEGTRQALDVVDLRALLIRAGEALEPFATIATEFKSTIRNSPNATWLLNSADLERARALHAEITAALANAPDDGWRDIASAPSGKELIITNGEHIARAHSNRLSGLWYTNNRVVSWMPTHWCHSLPHQPSERNET